VSNVWGFPNDPFCTKKLSIGSEATQDLPELSADEMTLKLLVQECKEFLSRRPLIDLRAGCSSPHRRNPELLVTMIGSLMPI
jgi:hypothetical protein